MSNGGETSLTWKFRGDSSWDKTRKGESICRKQQGARQTGNYTEETVRSACEKTFENQKKVDDGMGGTAPADKVA